MTVSPMQCGRLLLIYVLLGVLAVLIAGDTAASVFSGQVYSLVMLRMCLAIDG